jgi:hypothetical protein
MIMIFNKRIMGSLIALVLALLVSACNFSWNEEAKAIKLVQESTAEFGQSNANIEALRALMSGGMNSTGGTWLDFANKEAKKNPNTRMQWSAMETPENRVYLVSFADDEGWGSRWEADLTSQIVTYVNNSEYLSRKYGLSRLERTETFKISSVTAMGFTGIDQNADNLLVSDPGYLIKGSIINKSGKTITAASVSGTLEVIYKEKVLEGTSLRGSGFLKEISTSSPWLPNTERSFGIITNTIDPIFLKYKPEYVFFRVSLSAQDPVGYSYDKDIGEYDLSEKWTPTIGRIGMGWEIKDGAVIVTEMTKSAPAFKSNKIKIGDELIVIAATDGEKFQNVAGMTYDGIRSLITGKPDTNVVLRLKRGNLTYDVALTRTLIPLLP